MVPRGTSWCRAASTGAITGVRALRIIRAELQKNGTCITERQKQVAVLGDLLIVHIVFGCLGNDGIDDIASDWDSQLANVPGHVHAALKDLTASVEDRLAKKRAPSPGRASSVWPVSCRTTSG